MAKHSVEFKLEVLSVMKKMNVDIEQLQNSLMLVLLVFKDEDFINFFTEGVDKILILLVLKDE